MADRSDEKRALTDVAHEPLKTVQVRLPSKKEIALLGDTLNIAARLVDTCRDSDELVIASADLLDQLVLPPSVAARSLGLIRLRGKKQAIELCALAQVTPDTRHTAL